MIGFKELMSLGDSCAFKRPRKMPEDVAVKYSKRREQ